MIAGHDEQSSSSVKHQPLESLETNLSCPHQGLYPHINITRHLKSLSVLLDHMEKALQFAKTINCTSWTSLTSLKVGVNFPCEIPSIICWYRVSQSLFLVCGLFKLKDIEATESIDLGHLPALRSLKITFIMDQYGYVDSKSVPLFLSMLNIIRSPVRNLRNLVIEITITTDRYLLPTSKIPVIFNIIHWKSLDQTLNSSELCPKLQFVKVVVVANLHRVRKSDDHQKLHVDFYELTDRLVREAFPRVAVNNNLAFVVDIVLCLHEGAVAGN